MTTLGPRAGRFNQEILALFDTSGVATPAPDVGSQILPVFDVNDLADASLLYLRGERLCQGYHALAAGGAGTYGKVGLLNPPSSSVLAVVDRFTIFNLAGASALFFYYLVPGGYGPGALGRRLMLDSRESNLQPACTINQVADAVAPGAVGDFGFDRINNNGSVERVWPLVLRPGWAFWIIINTVNVAFDANIRWRERALGGFEEARP